MAVLDFPASTIDQVIEKVLDMDKAQNSNNMLMEALQKVLPNEEALILAGGELHNMPKLWRLDFGVQNPRNWHGQAPEQTHSYR